MITALEREKAFILQTEKEDDTQYRTERGRTGEAGTQDSRKTFKLEI